MRPNYGAGALGLIEQILLEHEDRPAPACAGQHEIFDKARYREDADDLADHRQARHQAAAICRTCDHCTDCSDAIGDTQ